ncbi:MAG: ribonuclease Z [Bacteroidetes bacterium 4572_77]|nr:MAG: ribonuclease Z [Bacteroidetes bacterium 4572_77]
METFSVTILGSSSAAPTSQRHTSGQLVNFYHRLYLIDCGEGIQMQLRRNHIKLSKIHHIFISHLHGDHFFGLVGLISSVNLFGRKKDLHIYTDPRLQEIIELQLEISESQLQFKIIYHALNFEQKALLFEDKKLEIHSYPLDHRIPTCGFLFQEKQSAPNVLKEPINKYKIGIDDIKQIQKGKDYCTSDEEIIPNKNLIKEAPKARSFAYCSDTKYHQKLQDFFPNVELLYAECTFMKDFQEVADNKYHMTTQDVARLALEVKANRLIVGHFSARYKDLGPMKEELKQLFMESELVYENKEYHIREEVETN